VFDQVKRALATTVYMSADGQLRRFRVENLEVRPAQTGFFPGLEAGHNDLKAAYGAILSVPSSGRVLLLFANSGRNRLGQAAPKPC